MVAPVLMGRRLLTPAGGHTVYAQRFDRLGRSIDYRIVNEAGETIGWMRGGFHGSRRVWSITPTYNGDFAGRYADMAHAAQGLLSRSKLNPSKGEGE